MEAAALNQPVNFEAHSCVDHAVEVAICVFERQGVRIYELLGNHNVDFWRKGVERSGSAGGISNDQLVIVVVVFARGRLCCWTGAGSRRGRLQAAEERHFILVACERRGLGRSDG